MSHAVPNRPAGSSPHERFEVLDGLRGVAAILVMFYHYLSFFDLWTIRVHGHSFDILFNGPLAVDFFFVLSGFVLSAAYGNRIATGMRFASYFLRRLIRVYPMYAIGMLLGLIGFLLTARAQGLGLDWPNFGSSVILSAFMIPDYVGQYGLELGTKLRSAGPFPLDLPGWSLFCELVVSASFVALYARSKRFLVVIVLISFTLIIISDICQRSAVTSHTLDLNFGSKRDDLWLGAFRAMAGFYIGVLIFRIRGGERWLDRAPFSWNIGPVWLLVLLALCLISPFHVRGMFSAIFIFVASPLLVIWGARIRDMTPRMERLSAWLGRISYPLYCVHYPIGQIVWVLGGQHGFSLWLDVALAAVLSFVVALLACVYIDEPVREYLSRAFLRRPISASGPS